jgi:hypothetical protein
MKKLTLSLVAAGLAASSLGAYAALPTGAAPFQVVVPNLKSGLELTLEGLYLQPTNSDLAYAAVTTTNYDANGNAVSNATDVSYLKPNYDFGFRVGLGYVFPNSGNDVQLNWTHFHHSTDASVVTPDLTQVSGISIDPNNSTQNGSVDFRYDAVDLDVGQYISIGTRLQTRLFFGVRGAELRKELTTTSFDNSAPAIDMIASTSNSKFIGIGPRVGIDSRYHIADCFGLVGHFATALLVGNVDVDGTHTESSNGSAIANSFTANTQTRVVPAFDAKLGLDYTFPFNRNEVSGSSMTVEAGYQVTQYVDAFDSVSFSSSSDKGVSNTFPSTSTSSVGFHGPYLSLNFKI